MMNGPIKEALKEVGRVVVSAILSYLLTEGVIDNLILIIFGDRLPVEVRAQLMILIGLLVRGFDKLVHEVGKEQSSDTLTKGLLRF